MAPPPAYTTNKLTWRTTVPFAVGAAPQATTAAIIGFFLLPFLLEVAKITPGEAGLTLALGRCWDAVTDPVVGYLLGRTDTRFGRLRVWIAAATVPCAVAYAAIWFPCPWGDTQAWLYHLAAYMLYQTATTAMHVPYTAGTMQLSGRMEERDKATKWRVAVEILGVLVAVSAHGFAVANNADDETGYMQSAVAFGVLVVLCGAVVATCVRQLRREWESDRVDSLGFLQGIALCWRSAAYRCLTMWFLFGWAAVLTVQGTFVLYTRYCVPKLESQFQWLLLALLLATVLSLPVWALASARWGARPWGKEMFYVAGSALLVPPLVFMAVASANTATPLFYLAAVVAGTGIGSVYFFPWARLPDIVDHASNTQKTRLDAQMYAFCVFLQKLAVGAALGMSSLALKWGGARQVEDDDPDSSETTYDASSVDGTLRVLVGPAACTLVLLSWVVIAVGWWYGAGVGAPPASTVAGEETQEVGLSEQERLLA